MIYTLIDLNRHRHTRTRARKHITNTKAHAWNSIEIKCFCVLSFLEAPFYFLLNNERTALKIFSIVSCLGFLRYRNCSSQIVYCESVYCVVLFYFAFFFSFFSSKTCMASLPYHPVRSFVRSFASMRCDNLNIACIHFICVCAHNFSLFKKKKAKNKKSKVKQESSRVYSLCDSVARQSDQLAVYLMRMHVNGLSCTDYSMCVCVCSNKVSIIQ